MAWFLWHQNNSGGSFMVNDQVTVNVYIEAESRVAAEEKAKQLGIYYNGVEDGTDCSCCGDRWYEPDELGQITKEEVIAAAVERTRNYGWEAVDARLFFLEGYGYIGEVEFTREEGVRNARYYEKSGEFNFR